MKYFTFLFFVLLSCSEKEELFIPEKFEIEKLEVEMPYQVRDLIKYENGYICRFDSYRDTAFTIGVLNQDFTLNRIKSKRLNQEKNQWFSAIWTSGDTLYGIVGGWRGYSKMYWNKDKWIFVESGYETKKNYQSIELNYPIYEDNDFIVSSCCRGEFGGAIYFRDKKTGKTYSCRATCLNSIQKLNGSFYVTSSLPHASGFATIIKIDNPRKLFEIKNKSQLVDCGWYDIYPEDSKDNEIKHPVGYDKGYETLLDTMDIHVLGAFSYKNHIYHIYSDDRNTYLSYITNKKLKIIDTLINKVSWHGELRDLKHNSNVFPIRRRDLNGVIMIRGNKIKLVAFK